MGENKQLSALKTVLAGIATQISENKEEQGKALEDLRDNMFGCKNELQVLTRELKDLKSSKETGAPIQVMKVETAKDAIRDAMSNVILPPAEIGRSDRDRINRVIALAESKSENTKPLLIKKAWPKVTISNGKTYFWIGVIFIALSTIISLESIMKTDNMISRMKDQAFYWGDRAYHAAILRDESNPGKEYHKTFLRYNEEPEEVKRYVEQKEIEAQKYQEYKKYILYINSQRDSRDIRIIDYEANEKSEHWILYRFYDEEKERSVLVSPNKTVKETTSKLVTDLSSALKYSKRDILWTTLREASEKKQNSDKECFY